MSWPEVKLGEIFDIARGGSPRPIDKYITEEDDGINWVSIKDATGSSKYITKTAKKIRKEGLSKSRLVKPGDFLLTNSMSFGRPYIMRTTGAIHDGWLVFSEGVSVNPDYFYHLLGTDLMYRKFSALAAGAVVKNLNINLVKSVKIPLPPLEEQQRIAAILDKADALRQKRRQAIAKLDELLQAVFLDMFGDPVTNPKGWPVTRLKELTSKIGSGATPKGGSESYQKDGISLIRSLNIHDGDFRFKNLAFINEIQAKKLENVVVAKNDVLLNITGASVARVCRVPDEVLPARVNQHVSILRCTELLNSVFLERLLIFPTMKARLLGIGEAGATRQAITKQQQEDLLIITPPLELQEKFLLFHSKLSSMLKAMDAQNQDLLFSSLQQRAFNGTL